MGQINVKIIGRTEIVENKERNKNSGKIDSPPLAKAG